jgi:hypothetical protein
MTSLNDSDFAQMWEILIHSFPDDEQLTQKQIHL